MGSDSEILSCPLNNGKPEAQRPPKRRRDMRDPVTLLAMFALGELPHDEETMRLIREALIPAPFTLAEALGGIGRI